MQRAITTPPPLTRTPPSVAGCEQCFSMLNATQQSAFEELLPDHFEEAHVTTIDQMCAVLLNLFFSDGSRIVDVLGH